MLDLRKGRNVIICAVEWCNNKQHGRGLCLNHYMRNRAYGHPYLHPNWKKEPDPEYPLSTRARILLRMLAHGDWVDINKLAYVMWTDRSSILRALADIRAKFGYDTVIHERTHNSLRLRIPVPGFKKHRSLM